MKNKLTKIAVYCISSLLLLTGCAKNDTFYYADPNEEGVAIFSNTGNNLLTCLINNKPWRTIDRLSFILFPPNRHYELTIDKEITNSLMDTLHFRWYGYHESERDTHGDLSLLMPVAKSFGYRDLAAFNRQRLVIDGVNSYFSSSTAFIGSSFPKGSGNIYFHNAVFDSLGPNNFSGRISGLFDADHLSVKITKGRFDHDLSADNVRLR